METIPPSAACLILFIGASGARAAPSSAELIQEGHRLYFAGKHSKAAAAYQRALTGSPRSLEALLNGAVVWGELGEAEKAANWLARAAALAASGVPVRAALAEVELSRGKPGAALAALEPLGARAASDPWALIAKGRAELALGRAEDSARTLAEAARAAPERTLAHYWLGRAREEAGDFEGAAEAYKRAAFGDSYFTQARLRLVKALLRGGRGGEALTQARRLRSMDPDDREFRSLEAAARDLRGSGPVLEPTIEEPPEEEARPMNPPASGRVPMLRVGIGTNGLGGPIARGAFEFSSTSAFAAIERATGKVLAKGEGGETWRVAAISGRKGRRVDLRGPRGPVVSCRGTVLVRPLQRRAAIFGVAPSPSRGRESERRLRGELEFSLYGRKASLSLVNIVDLESYTHGVLAAEMPVNSPGEALKAQAVVARTDAMYLKGVLHRHRKHGYDLCDEQHCQVYSGVKQESSRSRTVVDATRGRVVTYHGSIAYLVYSSNCGGHSQSGSELSDWGRLPYWRAQPDGEGAGAPRSPWGLRQWLRGRPPAFCRPSAYVHASHFRWTRVVPASEIEARLDRILRVGKLKAILPLGRSPSGYLNSVQVRGSRRTAVVTAEIRIRGLFAKGSQRSALFALDTQLDAKGAPKFFTFYGGGWGHGIGMCQSGAMGRAEAGQSYADILKTYYPGTEIGNLRY